MSFPLIQLSYMVLKTAAKPLAEIIVKYYVCKGLEAIKTAHHDEDKYIIDIRDIIEDEEYIVIPNKN
jgi:hypothetical protein